jgi:hypothetical protein
MKVKQIPKIQIEHSHSIVDFNVTQKNNKEYFDLGLYDNNVFDLLDTYPRTKSNIFYKKIKFMFSNIKRTNQKL